MKGGGKGGLPSFTQSYAAPYQKGSGKGYQGFCFGCGKQGHKAAECRSRRTDLVESEQMEEEPATKEIGGIWLMGHVDKLVETHNRYQELEEGGESTEFTEEEGPAFTKVKDRKRKPTFTGNSKINLTTRNTGLPKSKTITKKLVANVTKETGGEQVANLTEKLIANADRVNSAVCQMTFHMTDVNKILASVTKMTEVGNQVSFNNRKSFIESPNGRRANLRKRGGVYVLDVVFFDGEQAVRGEVIVDSGAADHVMPKGMLTGIATKEKEFGTKFVAADGGELGNYGRKEVQFCPLDFWEDEFGSPFQGRAF